MTSLPKALRVIVLIGVFVAFIAIGITAGYQWMTSSVEPSTSPSNVPKVTQQDATLTDEQALNGARDVVTKFSVAYVEATNKIDFQVMSSYIAKESPAEFELKKYLSLVEGYPVAIKLEKFTISSAKRLDATTVEVRTSEKVSFEDADGGGIQQYEYVYTLVLTEGKWLIEKQLNLQTM